MVEKVQKEKLIKENCHVLLVDNQGNAKVAKIEEKGYLTIYI